MTYLTPPTTGDLRQTQNDRRTEMKQAWEEVSLHLKRHKERLKLSDWDQQALLLADAYYGRIIKDELETLLRNFFSVAGSNYALEKDEYKRRKKNNKHDNVD